MSANLRLFLSLSCVIPFMGLPARAKENPIPEKTKLCQQYEGAYLAYYDRVYKIQGCKRYTLTDEEVYNLTRQKIAPQEVKEITSILQAIPSAGTLGGNKKPAQAHNPCVTYNRQYVTDGVEVFWVENCKLQQFPDWASYEHHRGSLRKNPPNLRYLEADEFAKFKQTTKLPSVIDEDYREIPEVVEVLPQTKVCSKLIGGYVSYLDAIYFIEAAKGGCRKRPVDAEEYTRLHGRKGLKLLELSSSQFVSIPLGEKLATSSAAKVENKVP